MSNGSRKYKVKSDNFQFSSTPVGEVATSLKDLKFPLIVMPVLNKEPAARIFVSGGAGSSTVTFWNTKGKKVKGHTKLRSQLRTAFKKLSSTPVTIEGYLTQGEDGDEKLICFDMHNSNAHASGDYLGTYEERITALSAFLGQCSVHEKNRIFGSCIKNFFDWDELWEDLFDPAEGLCTLFPYVSMRGQGSEYVQGKDTQWMVVSGEWLHSQQEVVEELLEVKNVH